MYAPDSSLVYLKKTRPRMRISNIAPNTPRTRATMPCWSRIVPPPPPAGTNPSPSPRSMSDVVLSNSEDRVWSVVVVDCSDVPGVGPARSSRNGESVCDMTGFRGNVRFLYANSTAAITRSRGLFCINL